MTDYLAKPVEPDKLREMLVKYLPGPGAGAAGSTDESLPVGGYDHDGYVVWDENEMRRRLMNNEMIIAKVLEVFLEETPNHLDSMEAALQQSEYNRVHTFAHSIKGSAGNIGAQRLRECAFAVEQAARASDEPTVFRMVPMVRSCFESLRTEIEAKFKTS